MANDISLAVGDGTRRMTYAEIADIRRISLASAMRLVRRKKWARQTGNDGVVRILVPLSAASDREQRRARLRGETMADKHDVRRERSRMSDRISAPDTQRTIAALESAITALRDQLEAERNRSLQAEVRAERAERRMDELQGRLILLLKRHQPGSVPAVQLATVRAPWWRRWFG
jgi:hypothetical protein